jgi:hypothetical protein
MPIEQFDATIARLTGAAAQPAAGQPANGQ